MSKQSGCESANEFGMPDILLDFISSHSWSPIVILRGATVIAVNDAWAKLLDYSDTNEPLGTTLADTLSPDSLRIAQKRIADRAAGRPRHELQLYDCITMAGTPIKVEVSTLPWPLDTNLTIGIVRDVTERENDIKALRESEGLYRVLAETMPDGVILTDRTGRVVYVNKEASAMTGFSVDELMEGVLFGHHEDGATRLTLDQALINGTSGANLQTHCVRKDGSTFWAEFCWQSISDEHGTPKRLYIVFTDITKRKQTEQRLNRLNECMLSFGVDPVENINRLIALCGELMDADNALYSYIDDGALVEWQGLYENGRHDEPLILSEGCICYDVVHSHRCDMLVVRDLPDTGYVHTDPRVAALNARTYVGRAVYFGGNCTGVIGVVYQRDHIATADDHRLMGFVAGAIGVEEERRRSVEALRQSEERFRHVLDCSRDGIFRLDIRDRCYDYLSPSMADFFGYSTEEILEMGTSGMWYRLHPDDFDHMTRELLSMLDLPPDAKPPTVEYRCRHKDGHYIWISDNRAIIRDGDGEPIACVGNVRDVTEQKHAEESLRESEKRYRGLVESQQDLIVRVNPEGMFTFVNDAYCQLFGKTRDELLGSSFVPLVHEDDIAATLTAMEKLNMSPYRVNVEQRAMTIHGWRWLAWEDCAILDEQGDIIEIQAVGRDITERRKADEALLKAYNDLTKAYELQREFLNNVTHEVRTPLVAVKGYADMLLEGVCGPLTDEQADLLKKVLSSSRHLLDIVGGVLDMARLKSGALAVRPTACKPLDIIERAIDCVSIQAAKRGVYLNLHCNGPDCMGLYDDEKIRTILTNLLSNAVKFTIDGGVDIYADCNKEYIEVIVVDSGIGIPEDEMNSIFAEFQQLDYPGKHKPTGFGLGLAIVTAMIDVVGGSLTVSSIKGTGTAFTLYIPCLLG